jgi:hypothetical protein
MSDTALVPINLDQLPSTQIGTDDQFAELAKGVTTSTGCNSMKRK